LAQAQAAQAAGPDATESRIVHSEVAEGERLVSPEVHGEFLNELHHVSVQSEEIGRHLQTILATELEPAIKELSVSLLSTQSAGGELADRVSKFEASMDHILESRKRLRESLATLQQLESRFKDLPPGTLPEVKEEE